MKIRGLKFASMVACALLTGSLMSGCAQDKEQVKKELEAQYEKMGAAFKAKDVKAMLAQTTDDVTVKDMNGKVRDRADLEKMTEREIQNTRAVKQWSNQITRLELKGNTVIATVEAKVVLEAQSEGRYHTYDLTQGSRDTWIKTSSGWKLKVEELTKDITLVDGKQIN
jgi:ketosteroid isomerase-like protein